MYVRDLWPIGYQWCIHLIHCTVYKGHRPSVWTGECLFEPNYLCPNLWPLVSSLFCFHICLHQVSLFQFLLLCFHLLHWLFPCCVWVQLHTGCSTLILTPVLSYTDEYSHTPTYSSCQLWPLDPACPASLLWFDVLDQAWSNCFTRKPQWILKFDGAGPEQIDRKSLWTKTNDM